MLPKPIIYLFTLFIVFVSNITNAQSYYEDSMKQVLQKVTSDRIKAQYLMQMGGHFVNNNPARAETYYRQGLAIDFKPITVQSMYRAEMAAGMNHIFIMNNNIGDAEKWMKQSLEYARLSGDAKTMAFIANTAVSCYTQMARYDKAIDCALLIIRINDSLHTPEKSLDAYNNLGYIFNRLPNYKKALVYYLKASDMQKNAKEKDRMASLNTNSGLAYSYYELRQFDSSYYYANLMYKGAVAEDAADIISSSLIQQAGALLKLKQYKAAVDAAGKGLKISLDNNITYLLSAFYGVMASGYAKMGQSALAREYITKSNQYLDTATETLKDKVDIYNIYTDVFEAEGNYKQAFLYKNMAYEAYEQVRDDEITAETTYSDALFNAGQKEKQIELLNAVNKKQRMLQLLTGVGLLLAVLAIFMTARSYRNKKRLAAVLQKSNSEKEVFLKEIHHRVKNNMQIIISLLHLQFKNNKDAEVAAGLKQAQQRIKSMALIHNKLYETEELVHIYLKEYIQDLSEAILEANNPEHKHISINVQEQEHVSLSLDTAISVGLMMNELITNSCKYAFQGKDNGTINVIIGKTESTYTLRISDNGKGLPNQFDKKGSLGVRLIRNLAIQLGGTAEFSNDNGTTVMISFTENQAA